jgi:ABC-2 type transport system permease protein
MRTQFRKLEEYYAVFLASLKSSMHYKTDIALSLIFRISTALLLIFVWTVIFASSGVSSLNGLTLPFVYAYFFLVAAMSLFISSEVHITMQDDIREGTIASSLVRPVNYITQLVLNSFGDMFIFIIFIGIPILIIGLLLAHVSVSPTTALLFVGEIILGNIFLFILMFLIGMAAIYFTHIWGLSWVAYAVIGLLGGAVLPLNFYPSAVQNIIFLTPMPMVFYTPISTLLGTISMQSAANSMIVTLLWIIPFAALVSYLWNRARKNITSAGG